MAGVAKTPTQAIVAVTLVSIVACWINWGFGLVIGALYAMELARQVKGTDYRLLIASAYSGFLVWHGGISGSIPLTLATGGEDLIIATNNSVTEIIPTNATIFSVFNLAIVGILLFTLPLINRAMHPQKNRILEVDPKFFDDARILNLGRKITVHYDASLQKGFPLKCLQRVKIFLDDGQILEIAVMAARGDHDKPLSDEELEEKFLKNLSVCIGQEKSIELMDLIENLEEYKADDLIKFLL